MPDDAVLLVQRLYPQIYLACHRDHVRARSTPFRLSSADASLLVHLESDRPMTPGALARHLGVAPSTLSAALSRLEQLGYITRNPRARDRRQVDLRLSAAGGQAIAGTSVLDANHVRGVLGCLAPAERKRAIAGLALLAQGARAYRRRNSARRSSVP